MRMLRKNIGKLITSSWSTLAAARLPDPLASTSNWRPNTGDEVVDTPMAMLGQLREFRPDQDMFSVYVEWFELLVAVNGVDDCKKVHLFLTMVGWDTYTLLHNLFALENPKEAQESL